MDSSAKISVVVTAADSDSSNESDGTSPHPRPKYLDTSFRLLPLQKERLALVAASISKADLGFHEDHPSYYHPAGVHDFVYPKSFTRMMPAPTMQLSHACDSSSDSVTGLSVELTATEKAVFDELVRFEEEVFSGSHHPVVMRAAGGWVRDKLLGCECDDVDLAVDSITGEEFGEALNQWCESRHISATSVPTITSSSSKSIATGSKRYSHSQSGVLKLGKIQSNPDKSKHLASVTFRMAGIEFDCTHLRSEEYAKGADSHSRVPTAVKFGSPLEDAMRRDLTVNALFYNLKTGQIEDWTRRGVADLLDGMGRTPLKAIDTYRDDPLRVLRNIRHCVTKLGFCMHPHMFKAMQTEEIHSALRKKVSRERFSIELIKMLKSTNSHVSLAFRIIVECGLADVLFYLPKAEDLVHSDVSAVSFQFDNALKNGVDFMRLIEDALIKEMCADSLTSPSSRPPIAASCSPLASSTSLPKAAALLSASSLPKAAAVSVLSDITSVTQSATTSTSMDVDSSADLSTSASSSLTSAITALRESALATPKRGKKVVSKKKREKKALFVDASERRKTLLFAAFLFDFRGLNYLKSKKRGGSDSLNIMNWFCLECIPGMGKQLAKNCELLHSLCNSLMNRCTVGHLADCGCFDTESGSFCADCNYAIGSAVVQMNGEWEDVLLLCAAVNEDWDCTRLSDCIEGSRLRDAHKWQPFWNGRDILKEFEDYGLTRGKRIGLLLKHMDKERLRNPTLCKETAAAVAKHWLSSHTE